MLSQPKRLASWKQETTCNYPFLVQSLQILQEVKARSSFLTHFSHFSNISLRAYTLCQTRRI